MSVSYEIEEPENEMASLGSVVVDSLKEAFTGCFEKHPSPPVGLAPFESWIRRLSYGDRLPRGRFFVGKRAGGNVSVMHYEEYGCYDSKKES